MFEVGVKLEDFCAQRFCLDGGRVARLDDVYSRDRERHFLLETGEAYALKPLENQIRCAVFTPNARANQTGTGKMKEIFCGVPFRATWFNQSYAEHPMVLKRVR